MQFATERHGAQRRRADRQHLQRTTRRSCWASRTSARESVQNELMTTREWQHGLYARDRWQVNNKLTLDLGLRYEYYPLMTRADRGIEQVGGTISTARSPTR